MNQEDSEDIISQKIWAKVICVVCATISLSISVSAVSTHILRYLIASQGIELADKALSSAGNALSPESIKAITELVKELKDK